jgi:hypothetical protein
LRFGAISGAFAYRVLFADGGSQSSIIQIFSPALSASGLLELVHVAGFCALSIIFILVGIGLW